MQIELDDEERQVILLALGHLAVERPGWDDLLGRIAAHFHGSNMYLHFRDLRRCEVGQTICEDHR